jgi:hypothetical protein
MVSLTRRYTELNEVAVLRCDFTKFRLEDFDRFTDVRDRTSYYKAQCLVRFSLIHSTLTVTIEWDGHLICTQQIEDGKPINKTYTRTNAKVEVSVFSTKSEVLRVKICSPSANLL